MVNFTLDFILNVSIWIILVIIGSGILFLFFYMVYITIEDWRIKRKYLKMKGGSNDIFKKNPDNTYSIRGTDTGITGNPGDLPRGGDTDIKKSVIPAQRSDIQSTTPKRIKLH